MADEILGHGSTSDAVWSIDYDDVSETIGLTVTGTPLQITIILTITSTQNTYSLDATQYVNQGRVVLGGPGSVLGKNAPIPPAAVPPPPVKGQPSSYQFTESE